MADPFHTRLAGGSPRNAFDGEPSLHLGTELDLGVRYQLRFAGSELTLGVEGGAFYPSSALHDANDSAMSPVYGGRTLLRYRL